VRVELSKKAQANLRAIAKFVQVESSGPARKWFLGLRAEILSLSEFPNRGEILQGKPAYRQILYGNKPHVYSVVYAVRPKLKVVFIAEVRHGARRPIR
jgi:toxin ParE1/3/4